MLSHFIYEVRIASFLQFALFVEQTEHAKRLFF